MLFAGSERDEWGFTAVLADASNPPRRLAMLAKTPRVAHDLGLGSSRTDVERYLGPAKSTTVCGYAVVRYEPRREEMTAAEMWFIYRGGSVVGFSRYEEV